MEREGDGIWREGEDREVDRVKYVEMDNKVRYGQRSGEGWS